MEWQRFALGVLILIILAAFGCAGITSYSSDAPGTPEMMGCNGDRSSGFPPYCRPGH